MSKNVYTLTSPDGKTMELPVRSGTVGPDVIEIGRLFAEQGVCLLLNWRRRAADRGRRLTVRRGREEEEGQQRCSQTWHVSSASEAIGGPGGR